MWTQVFSSPRGNEMVEKCGKDSMKVRSKGNGGTFTGLIS